MTMNMHFEKETLVPTNRLMLVDGKLYQYFEVVGYNTTALGNPTSQTILRHRWLPVPEGTVSDIEPPFVVRMVAAGKWQVVDTRRGAVIAAFNDQESAQADADYRERWSKG